MSAKIVFPLLGSHHYLSSTASQVQMYLALHLHKARTRLFNGSNARNNASSSLEVLYSRHTNMITETVTWHVEDTTFGYGRN